MNSEHFEFIVIDEVLAAGFSPDLQIVAFENTGLNFPQLIPPSPSSYLFSVKNEVCVNVNEISNSFVFRV